MNGYFHVLFCSFLPKGVGDVPWKNEISFSFTFLFIYPCAFTHRILSQNVLRFLAPFPLSPGNSSRHVVARGLSLHCSSLSCENQRGETTWLPRVATSKPAVRILEVIGTLGISRCFNTLLGPGCGVDGRLCWPRTVNRVNPQKRSFLSLFFCFALIHVPTIYPFVIYLYTFTFLEGGG